MKTAIRTNIDDHYFKANESDYQVLNCDVIKFSEVNELSIDSIRLGKLIDKQDDFLNKIKIHKEEMQRYGSKMLEYAVFGLDNPLYKQAELKMINSKNEGQALYDSVIYYLKKDSLLRIEMSEKEKPKPLYKATAFIKVKAKSGNVADTLTYYADKDFNLIKI
ncbi:hypothetical protein [Pseudopedobacter saltans]|nr:hypothetical protein [Pseudopedobacter saltans]